MAPPSSALIDEHLTAQLGEMEICYTLRRTRRRKTMSITVDPRTGVMVSVPRETSAHRAAGFVQRKGRWILKVLQEVRSAEGSAHERGFTDGEPCLYLGQQYRLAVRESPATEAPATEALLKEGQLVVEIAPGLTYPQAREAVRQALINWYLPRARKQLPERIEKWRSHFSAMPPQVIVKDQRRRWGSCNAQGVIRLNWRLVQAPLDVVDYVAVHELAHLHHRGHQANFWQAVGRVFPDYKTARQKLRTLGPALMW